MVVPINFRDANCCLTCAHSEVLHAYGRKLHCTKFDTTCEDTTTCDEWEEIEV